jgi:PilZ domain
MAILNDHSDRRASRRRSLDEIPEVTAVKVQSEEVAVVNASRGGILIECGLRLPPGTASQLEIQKVDGPLRVRGRVVRCEVTRVSSERLHYRIAFAFSDNVDFISDEEFIAAASFDEPSASPAFQTPPSAAAARADVEVVELESFALNSW